MTKQELVNELEGISFLFQNQKVMIGKRTNPKPKQGILYAYFPDREKPFRNLSSLYFTPEPTLLALEYKKKYYTISTKDLSIAPDTEGLWKLSKYVPQRISENP